jgi:hypothetical protein
VKSVKAPFIFNEQVNDQARGKANGETENVDESIQQAFADIAQRGGKVIFEHGDGT